MAANITTPRSCRGGSHLDWIYYGCCNCPHDINEHLPTLKRLSEECDHVTEFGVRDVFSTYAFLAARPKKVVSYDIYESPSIQPTRELAAMSNVDWEFHVGDTLVIDIAETDLLFIDTKHTYDQLKAELARHEAKARKYIVLHDTTSFGEIGEQGVLGLWPAVVEFLDGNKNWKLQHRYENNNGLTVLERVQPERKVRVSIVIPTYNHCDDLLKPCVDSILEHTDMTEVEVVISANGCTDGTKAYLASLPSEFVTVWSDGPLGYTKATNLGIKKARGEFVVLLNNDVLLLPQATHDWINLMLAPFKDEKVGMSGPLKLYDAYAGRDVLIFFCVMIRKQMFDVFGLLDESFSPGGGEDIDFSVKIEDGGYRWVRVPEEVPLVYSPEAQTNVSTFPIWHKGEGTFDEIPEYSRTIIKRNGFENLKRYNKHIRLNLGSGGVHVPGFISVDMYDYNAHVMMDVTKIDLPDNTVEEILASHLFEHLNPYHAGDVLAEWLRVLKPGGKLVMEMPDFLQTCQQFLKEDKAGRYGLLNTVYGSVNTTGKGDPSEITSPHLWGWYPEILWDHLVGVGYVDVVFMPEQIKHPGLNMRVEARKAVK